jgi:hypothetical protein
MLLERELDMRRAPASPQFRFGYESDRDAMSYNRYIPDRICISPTRSDVAAAGQTRGGRLGGQLAEVGSDIMDRVT